MRTKLPGDAFAYYVSLGPDRGYAAVASYFQVDKTTVVRRAKEERWQEKLADLERQAQERTQAKIVDSLEEMNTRHLKVLRTVLGKALEALRATPLKTASDAVRAIDMCVKHERTILGEPTDRADVNIEQVIKREYERWLIRTDPATPTDASAKVPIDDSIRSGVLADPSASTGPAHPGMPVSPPRPDPDADPDEAEDDEDEL